MSDCLFCKIINGELPSYKVYEDEHTYAFLDIRPQTKYHTLVIPKKHYVNVLDIPSEILAHVTATTKKVVDLYAKKLGVTNVNLVHNAGDKAQQMVFHFHMHIIPRGDWDDSFDDLLARLQS